MKRFILLTFMTVFMFMACSDDDSPTDNNNTTTEYFPMKVGNFWVYNEYERDMDNNIIDDDMYVDSTTITGLEEKFSQMASIFTSFYDGDMDNSYMYADGKKLYVLSEDISPGGEDGMIVPIEIPQGWYKFADFDATAPWTLFEDSITNESVTIPYDELEMDGTLNATLKMTCEKAANKTFTVMGKSISATDMKSKYIFDGKITISPVGFPVDVPITFTITMHNYFAPGIGLVATEMESTTVRIEIPMSPMEQDLPGYESVLVNYHIVD